MKMWTEVRRALCAAGSEGHSTGVAGVLSGLKGDVVQEVNMSCRSKSVVKNTLGRILNISKVFNHFHSIDMKAEINNYIVINQ